MFQKKLYYDNESNIYFLRELDRVLNLTNAALTRIKNEYIKHIEHLIEKDNREFTLIRYLEISIENFKEMYSFGKERIKEINGLSNKNSNNIDVEKPQQEQKEKLNLINTEIEPNLYPKIFKNDKGFNLFNEMHKLYKDEIMQQAYYSFLFIAMENEFLVCKQIEFVNFIATEPFNVHIDKIDSRQNGANKKLSYTMQ